MTLDDIKRHFGTSYNFSKQTGLAHSNFVYWRKIGYIPIVTQKRLENMTDCALLASFDHGEGTTYVESGRD